MPHRRRYGRPISISREEWEREEEKRQAEQAKAHDRTVHASEDGMRRIWVHPDKHGKAYQTGQDADSTFADDARALAGGADTGDWTVEQMPEEDLLASNPRRIATRHPDGRIEQYEKPSNPEEQRYFGA